MTDLVRVDRDGDGYRVSMCDVELVLSREQMVDLMHAFYVAVRNELWVVGGR